MTRLEVPPTTKNENETEHKLLDVLLLRAGTSGSQIPYNFQQWMSWIPQR